jgi:beta-glucosidase
MGADCIQWMKDSYGGSDVDFAKDSAYVTESKIPVANDEKNNLTVDDLAGYTDYNDEIWDKLVNEMSVDEQALLLEDCGYGTPAIESIGKKLATDIDGPAGISSMNLNFYGNEYTSEPVMAATFNVDLVKQVGESVAREAKIAGINGWYAPGADTHRTPFNGRCGEYFSEDGLLAGKMAQYEVNGAQSKGLYVYLKHCACNDNDNKRGGMYTWINEQELREVQLRAWEFSAKDGLSGIMEAYNRIGTMESSACYGLNTTVFKKEWGYKGMGVTDGYSPNIGCDKYEHPDIQLRAGCGELLFTGGYNGNGGFTVNTTQTKEGLEMLHDACRRMIYRHCNSNAMTTTRDYTPRWIWVVAAVNAVLVAGCACSLIFLVAKPLKDEKKPAKKEEK